VTRTKKELTLYSIPIRRRFNGHRAAGGAAAINPQTGLPEAATSALPAANPWIQCHQYQLTLTDVRLADVLDAIVLVADHPIKYSVQDYAVVFSAKGPEPVPLETRTFKIDPNTFVQGLESVGPKVLVQPIQRRRGGSSGGGGGGGQAEIKAAAPRWQS